MSAAANWQHENQRRLMAEVYRVRQAVEVFLARKGALRTLEAGVTTVRDLGADQYMDIAMRDLINH